MQWTRQLPVHFAWQLLDEVHVTTLPSPTVGPQSLTLLQLYVQSAPHVAAQVVVPWQATLQWSPQVTVHPGPLMHPNMHPSPHVALQLLAKSVHVGAHIRVSPQSRLALPPHCVPTQVHAVPLHGTCTVLSLEHARSAPTNAAGTTR